jgi:hypothetical protein
MSRKFRSDNQDPPDEARGVYRIFFFSQSKNQAVSHGRKKVPLTAVAGKLSSFRSFNHSASQLAWLLCSQILTLPSQLHNDNSSALLLLWKGM